MGKPVDKAAPDYQRTVQLNEILTELAAELVHCRVEQPFLSVPDDLNVVAVRNDLVDIGEINAFETVAAPHPKCLLDVFATNISFAQEACFATRDDLRELRPPALPPFVERGHVARGKFDEEIEGPDAFNGVNRVRRVD